MNRILSLQFLRAFACLSVLCTHVLEILHIKPFGDYYISGGYGVDIFFILSGFLIYITTKQTEKWKGFAIKRIFRIFPMYWASFFLLLSWFLVNTQERYSFIFYLQNLLMMPWSAQLTSKSLLVGVAWSTVYEVYFYFVFTLLLLFRLPKKYIGLLLVIIFIIMKTILKLDLFGLGENSFFQYISSVAGRTHIVPFLIGIGIGMVVGNQLLPNMIKQHLKLTKILFLLMHVIYFFILITQYFQTKSYIVSMIIFVLWIHVDHIWKINYQLPICRFLLKIGDVSYSIYLLHILVITVLLEGFGIKDFGFLLFTSFIFSISLSLITYKFIEEPSIRFAKRIAIKYN